MENIFDGRFYHASWFDLSIVVKFQASVHTHTVLLASIVDKLPD